jgi:hypothetical protein
MFKWLAKKWMLKDPLPQKTNIIAVISYGATLNRLTNGSEEVVNLAEHLSVIVYSDTSVIWGSFSKNPNCEYGLEQLIKKGRLPGSIYAGLVSSTTDECKAIKEAVRTIGKPAGTIVVIAEGAHSRRCKIVWEYFFPNSEICFRSIPPWRAGDKENPMWFQKNWRIWLLINICLYPFYKWFPGVGWFAKKNFSQPASH